MKNRFFYGILTLFFATLSLAALSVGISAKAAQSFRKLEDYTDSQRIQYRESVAVISAIQVMDGYTDGSFRPDGYLTRGAASKIIANLAITPDDGEWYKKVMQKNPFVDVTKEHVFGVHISYCFHENLISGYENHTFRPADYLTYNAFLKMLLCVLGHDQYGEGYAGEGWSQRVRADAGNNGLLMGFHETFDGGAYIPREVAALFAFNALQANQVDYSNGVAAPRVVDDSISKYKTIRDATVHYANGQSANQIVQFGEERFPKLRRSETRLTDEGLVAVTWQINGDTGWENIVSYSAVNPFRDYLVSLNPDVENDAFEYEPIVVTNGGVYGELPTPERSGYGFEGWFTNDGERILSGVSSVWLDGDITLYAHWTLDRYYVYFNGNGGFVSPDSMEIPSNGVLRNFPANPTRNGYSFSGWYTEAQGGEQIRRGGRVSPSSSITLFAHWRANPYRVTFVADGATVEPPRITVRQGESYGPLPELGMRDGEPFSGWYAEPNGTGQKIEETTIVNLNGDQTLYAYWGYDNRSYEIPQSHTVTFHADGLEPSQIPAPMTLNLDERLLELPRLESDESRRFLGWFYNGAPVSLPLTVSNDMDLYALWAETMSSNDFSYGFDNSAKGFGYPPGVDKKMLIPRYGLIFGDNALAKQIYQYDVAQNGFEWRGNCYGMSTTAGMFQYFDNDIYISDFDEPERGLKKPSEIKIPTEPLKEFIEAMQVSQKTISFVKTYWENIGSLNGLCEEISRVSETNGGAVVICIYNRDEGHALLGYYLEERNDHMSYVHVYDSNFPLQTRYLVLSKDDNGNYTSWAYDDAREYNTEIVRSESEGVLLRWSSANGGTITYIPYEKYFQIWRRRGNQDISMNLLTTNLTDAAIYDSEGKQLASFRHGEIENPDDIRRNGIYPLVSLEENPSNDPRTVAVWLPDENEYRIENASDDASEQTVALSSAERSISVTTSARAVSLSVDRTRMDAENRSHFILRADIEGQDDNLQVRVDGVSLPQRVDAPALTNQTVSWSGSASSGMELTLDLLYDGTLTSLKSVSDGETNSLFVGGENMTEHLNNSPDGVILFDDISG